GYRHDAQAGYALISSSARRITRLAFVIDCGLDAQLPHPGPRCRDWRQDLLLRPLRKRVRLYRAERLRLSLRHGVVDRARIDKAVGHGFHLSSIRPSPGCVVPNTAGMLRRKWDSCRKSNYRMKKSWRRCSASTNSANGVRWTNSATT